jgi:sporulation protein YunB
MRRHYRPTKFQKFKRKLILFVAILLVLSFFVTRSYFNKTIQAYAVNKAKLHMSIIINEAISKEVVPNIVTEELMFFKTKENGHVTNVIIDVYQINNVIAKMTADMQWKLQNEVSKETLKLPLGVMLNHPFFNNLGPTVKIGLQMVGNVQTDIVTRTSPYGINNSLMEVLIKTEVSFLVIIPFREEEVTVTTHTPLVIKMIQGEVPQYYYNSSASGDGSFIYPPRDIIGN